MTRLGLLVYWLLIEATHNRLPPRHTHNPPTSSHNRLHMYWLLIEAMMPNRQCYWAVTERQTATRTCDRRLNTLTCLCVSVTFPLLHTFNPPTPSHTHNPPTSSHTQSSPTPSHTFNPPTSSHNRLPVFPRPHINTVLVLSCNADCNT